MLLATTAACGGSGSPSKPPATAENPPPATGNAQAVPSSTPAAAGTAAAAPAAPSSASSAEAAEYDDHGTDPTTLTPLFDKSSQPAFPKATVGEHDCWQTVSVTGNAKKDYESIVAKCGAATGAVEYVRPTLGKLHVKHDKRDTFIVPIRGGLCYRFFGVADASIQDLDILIEKKGGALVGDDKTNGPVAIIESDKAWCMDTDGTYNFLVEVDGGGQGNYVFGVWARKK
jgi:hypothetical protein